MATAPTDPGHPAAARRRRLGLVLLVAALAGAGWLWPQRGLLREHAAAWQSAAPPVQMRYAGLSPAMDEAALQRHYPGLAWRCGDAAPARQCEAAVASADGVPAARLRASFMQGRLQSLVLDVPWWRQHELARTLVQTLGAPDTVDPRDIAWRLPAGRLQLPRAPGLQPLRWTELRWTTPAPG